MNPVEIPDRCLGVVIPVYNEEKTLHLIVEKVLARPEVAEVVIVNDCSKDGTWETMQDRMVPACLVHRYPADLRIQVSGSPVSVEKLNSVDVARFDLGESYQTDPGMAAEVGRYQDFVRGGGFDVIVNQCWKVWPTALSVPLFRELQGAKVMVSHGYSLHTYLWARKLTLGLGVWLRGLL